MMSSESLDDFIGEFENSKEQEAFDLHAGKKQLTELTNTEELIRLYGDDIRYCEEWKKWFIWDGRRWAFDRCNEIKLKAKNTIRHMYITAGNLENDKERKRIIKHALKSETRKNINDMIELAKPERPITPEQFDTNPYLLNVKNGTIDLKTGLRIEHKKEDLITKLAPVEYIVSAECPMWLNFLDEIMDGNEDLIEYLPRCIGYALTGDLSEQVLFILHGPGENGKTTFL